VGDSWGVGPIEAGECSGRSADQGESDRTDSHIRRSIFRTICALAIRGSGTRVGRVVLVLVRNVVHETDITNRPL
jgi:hypothetical protein